MRPGSVLNAPGVYVWYHMSALQKASRLAHEHLSADERGALARAALFDEAFALHFLEDMFAAGHVAGSWGDVSQRKGTHDFYNQNGLEVFTWTGRDKTIVLMGDAHMRPEGLPRFAAEGGAHQPRRRCSIRRPAGHAATTFRTFRWLPSSPDDHGHLQERHLSPASRGPEGKGRYRPALRRPSRIHLCRVSVQGSDRSRAPQRGGRVRLDWRAPLTAAA